MKLFAFFFLSAIATAQPALFSTPFIYGGEWTSTVTIHNLKPVPASVPLTIFTDGKEATSTVVELSGRATVTVAFPRSTATHTGYVRLTPACTACVVATMRNEYHSAVAPATEAVTAFAVLEPNAGLAYGQPGHTKTRQFYTFAGGRQVKLLLANPGDVSVMVLVNKLTDTGIVAALEAVVLSPSQVVIMDGAEGSNAVTTTGDVTIAALALTAGGVASVPVF